MPNVSVDKRVDLCTEKEYLLPALTGTPCHCGFPTTQFLLHQREEEQLCMQKCRVEELESCGTPSHCRGPDADNCCTDRSFLPAKSRQLIALASFPGTSNTWAHHLIELATGFYTGSYYFNGSLYNKVARGNRSESIPWLSHHLTLLSQIEGSFRIIDAKDPKWINLMSPFQVTGVRAQLAPWWATHTLDWLQLGKKVLVVHFKDLQQDLFVQLGRMVCLLGVAMRQDQLLISAYIKMVDVALQRRNLTGVRNNY
ncbi:WSC domain-containing protein 2 [Sciurus carolinensis]|uniref:WSC domain-containing protein 2 n=1 Tax=Sciurus carolinensis TaxID=30640 RepID=A0AA41NE26_SCICA|nr:WSC domain-containing protein 2 [Sciurus carolinensis]